MVSVEQLAKLLLGLILGLKVGTIAFLFALPQTILAQSLERDPSQDFQRQDSGDPFSGGGTGGGFSPFDLIHRANLGNNRSIEDFSAEQNQSLDDATAEFRRRQRERLQIPQNPGVSTEPVNTAPAPAPAPAN